MSDDDGELGGFLLWQVIGGGEGLVEESSEVGLMGGVLG